MKKKMDACNLCKGNCYGCFYADSCGNWNDTDPSDIPQITIESKEASMVLCEGRHNISEAVDGAIFENELNPLAVEVMEEFALRKLESLDLEKLNLYVTGLTVALVAVLNACHRLNIKVTLYHYDRESGEYYPQRVC